jgi:hypothetical protein
LVYTGKRVTHRLRPTLIGLVLMANLAFAASASASAVEGRPRLSRDDAAVQRHMRAYSWAIQASSSTSTHSFSLVPTDGSRPIYFGSPTDPVMTIRCDAWYGAASCHGANGVNANGAHIHVPAGATPAANGDAHMSIVETDTGREYDLWHAAISGTTITAATSAEENVQTSDGTGDGGDAASLALTGGLLRPSELMSGHIDHALAMTVPCTSANGANAGFSWPASGGWGDVCGQYLAETARDAPPIGALFKLNMTDRQIAASGAPAWERTIMTALAHYGAYAEDTNGSAHAGLSILMQDPTSWTSIGQRDQWSAAVAKFHGHDGWLSSRVPIRSSRLELVAPCVQRLSCRAPRHRRGKHLARAAR